jgi:hypothetical protein
MGHTRPKQSSSRYRKQNKHWWLIVAGLAGVLVIGLAFWGLRAKAAGKAAIEITGSPSLKTDYRAIDLGNVPFNKPVQVVFKLTNVGDRELRFTEDPYIEVVAGC